VCERVLRESDGALSAIRIVDQVTLPKPPAELQPDAPVVLTFLVSMKGFMGSDSHKLEIKVRPPEGEEKSLGGADVTFASTSPGAVPGANLVVTANLFLSKTGLFWFDVLLDEDYITAIPLEVRVAEPVSSTTQPGG